MQDPDRVLSMQRPEQRLNFYFGIMYSSEAFHKFLMLPDLELTMFGLHVPYLSELTQAERQRGYATLPPSLSEYMIASNPPRPT